MPPRSLLNAQRDGTLACKVVAATVFGAYRRDGPCNAGWIRTAATRLCFLLQHGQRKGIFVPLVRLVLLGPHLLPAWPHFREIYVARRLGVYGGEVTAVNQAGIEGLLVKLAAADEEHFLPFGIPCNVQGFLQGMADDGTRGLVIRAAGHHDVGAIAQRP